MIYKITVEIELTNNPIWEKSRETESEEFLAQTLKAISTLAVYGFYFKVHIDSGPETNLSRKEKHLE